MTSRITMNSNHSNYVRSGISTKGQVISIGNLIDFSNFKKIGTRNYWINNNINIWNSLTIVLKLKLKTGYTPMKLNI
jgi:ribosomal protein S8E